MLQYTNILSINVLKILTIVLIIVILNVSAESKYSYILHIFREYENNVTVYPLTFKWHICTLP